MLSFLVIELCMKKNYIKGHEKFVLDATGQVLDELKDELIEWPYDHIKCI